MKYERFCAFIKVRCFCRNITSDTMFTEGACIGLSALRVNLYPVRLGPDDMTSLKLPKETAV